MKKKFRHLLLPLLFAFSVSSLTIEGIFPNAGPTTGETRVTVYSPAFKGLNSTDHPTPKCEFPGSPPQQASWIHCYGSTVTPSSKRDQTCLNCISQPHPAGTIRIRVSIKGDFSDTAEASFTYYTPPKVGYATPFLGYKSGGTFVEVHGENFANFPDLYCAFGTVHVPAKFVSSTLLTCVSPPSDIIDASIPLRITQNNQQVTSTYIDYYYHTIPEISVLLPDEGPVTGGNEVYISGRQMQPFQSSNVDHYNISYVRFGEHVSRLEIINRTHIRTFAPPSATASPVIVEISFNNQEWTDNGIPYYYYLSPYVVKLVPNLGTIEGNTNVTVIGANLFYSEEIKCRFGDNIVEGFYINETSVWCLSPPNEKVGPVDFSLAIEKNHFSGANLKYTYIKDPVINSIYPTCGPTTGGTQIAVEGEDFVTLGLEKVFCIFGKKIRQAATLINDTLIYCETPSVVDKPNEISSLHFSLTLNGIDVIDSSIDFQYYTQPQLTSISPKIGPVEGDVEVFISSTEIKDYCEIVCRFATVEVPGTLSEEGQVSCQSPAVSCSGDSLVQLSLNGQQFTSNDYELQDTVFTSYKVPVVAYALPTHLPSGGNSSIGIYGSHFLLSKNSSTLPSGASKMIYQCRFKETGGDVIDIIESAYFTDNYIHCKTPKLENIITGVSIDISLDGSKWIPVPSTKITFYNSPEISSIEPSFGRIKQHNTTLTVRGKYLDCPNDNCNNVKCSFSGAGYQIFTEGTRKSSSEVICEIPSLSRPDQTLVQVTLNGGDYTPQKLPYTFYEAFVVNVEPPYIPVEGDVNVKVIGLGFADSSQLKVSLQNPNDSKVLRCDGVPCILPATFISSTEISFEAPPQSSVQTAEAQPIGFNSFAVEVSIYNDEFTNNKVQLSYFQQPTVGAKLTVEGGSFIYTDRTVSTIFVPIKIKVPENVREEEFLRKARIACRFSFEDQTETTEGKLVEYPYPAKGGLEGEHLNVQCPTPSIDEPGKGTVSVALNGQDFVGNLPVTVLAPRKIESVGPKCGPREGGTKIKLKVDGIQASDYNNLFFTWSTTCTDPFSAELFKDSFIHTVTPPAPQHDSTLGGSSLVVFTAKEKVAFQDNSTKQAVRNHFESTVEFLYYKRPIISRISPHGGVFTGGTPVIIEGAFFFTDPKLGCVPKCKFGDKLVEAEVLSPVRIRCVSPSGKLGEEVVVSITVNGQDSAESTEPQTFSYIGTPIIKSISPVSGPSTGGTVVYLTGKDFVDMSKYPEEFTCLFSLEESDEPARALPAFYVNSTAISCSTPGGWEAGSIANVAVSFNGIDASKDEAQFRFYQIDKVSPLSGPSIGGSTITISGSGLTPEEKKGSIGCKIGAAVAKATRATDEEIVCILPPASQGANFHGHVDFYFTLDGEKWEHVIQGFNYYQQPEIHQITPKQLPANGGVLKVQGINFVPGFASGVPSCRIDDVVVLAEKVSATEITCAFNDVEFDEDEDYYLQVSLNNASFTEKTEETMLSVYAVSSIKPSAGVFEGGTQLLVAGRNFPTDLTPVCKFGIPGRTTTSYGSVLNENNIVCPTPDAKINPAVNEPFAVPFSVSFDKDQTNIIENTNIQFFYYRQPEVVTISPKQMPVDQMGLITITSSSERAFDSYIGSNDFGSNDPTEFNIVCRFGKFGSTSGALLAYNQIACLSPNTKIAAKDLTEETVMMQIAMNGQDYIQISVPFKFVGTKTDAPSAPFNWTLLVLISGIVIFVVFTILFRSAAQFRKGELVEETKPQAASQDKVIC